MRTSQFGIEPIMKKLRERRLRWCSHVIHNTENSLVKTGLSIEVDGAGPKGRPIGRCAKPLTEKNTERGKS